MKLFLKNLVFTLLVPGTVTVVIPALLLASVDGPATDRWWWSQALAFPVGLAGLAVYLWCVWDFAHHGRGTPAPVDAPRVLVVYGLYRYVRNPMYVGVFCVLLAEVLYFQEEALVWYLAAWTLAVQLFVLLYEEPALQRRFGADYTAYRAHVGRWIPGRPYRGEQIH